ncbi:hypothetical protein HU200_033366 [Digitaria exilis]|uniref:Uncharacterized protein n=1 Tax=Digitaria exilis TaxID=1010633 RepID=A0A835BLX9_9POAL|nr:hypothetical protein HU200_033366 [Digitaria exilis]
MRCLRPFRRTSLYHPVASSPTRRPARDLYDAFLQATSTTNTTEAVEMHARRQAPHYVRPVPGWRAARLGRRGRRGPRVAAWRRPGAPSCSPPWASSGRATSDPKRRRVPHPQRARVATGDGRTCLLFPVDHCSRMNPPLPGNCVGPAQGTTDALAAGLLSACAAVKESINEAVHDDRAVSVRLAEVQRAGPWARPLGEGVDIVFVARTGAVAVAESRRGTTTRAGWRWASLCHQTTCSASASHRCHRGHLYPHS